MDDSADNIAKMQKTTNLPPTLALKRTTTILKKKKKGTRENECGESTSYFPNDKWWMKHDVPEATRCSETMCSFEPDPHPKHNKTKKFMSFVEKKILVKFLINENSIKQAKGNKIYELMIKKGYLTHRTGETLRNCFKRTVLYEIDKYNLQPNHLKLFKELL